MNWGDFRKQTEQIEDADLALAEDYVNQLMPLIEEVAKALDDPATREQLLRDQVAQICNFPAE